jgi:hypothetical protein
MMSYIRQTAAEDLLWMCTGQLEVSFADPRQENSGFALSWISWKFPYSRAITHILIVGQPEMLVALKLQLFYVEQNSGSLTSMPFFLEAFSSADSQVPDVHIVGALLTVQVQQLGLHTSDFFTENRSRELSGNSRCPGVSSLTSKACVKASA